MQQPLIKKSKVAGIVAFNYTLVDAEPKPPVQITGLIDGEYAEEHLGFDFAASGTESETVFHEVGECVFTPPCGSALPRLWPSNPGSNHPPTTEPTGWRALWQLICDVFWMR